MRESAYVAWLIKIADCERLGDIVRELVEYGEVMVHDDELSLFPELEALGDSLCLMRFCKARQIKYVDELLQNSITIALVR